ncbi:hypothetical protein REPUB_Repub08aG0226000 [Reevesia pubescens]
MADLELQQLSSMGKKSKSMYMVFRFDEGPILYTLYSFTNINLSHTPQKQSPRSNSILHMSRDKFPSGMGFIALGSKLYCIGGQFQRGSEDNTFSSKKVYVVDVDTIETCYKENSSPFVEIPDMHEGKSYPYVFEVHGKVYVLDGNIDIGNKIKQDRTDKGKLSFEVFDPKVGEWTVLPEYDYNNFLNSFIKGHAMLGDRVFFWDQSRTNFYFRLSSFDVKNKKWFYEKKYRKNKDEDKVIIKDYISVWNEALKHGILGSSVVVNDTLYALKILYPCNGVISTYHISNNEDDRSIPCDLVCGIEIELPTKSIKLSRSCSRDHEYLHIYEADLVHFGDENFCLVTGPTQRRGYKTVEDEIIFLTFQTVKKKSSQGDQFSWWANIYDFRAVEGIDPSLGMTLYNFVA